jgi:THO complex subunit 3
VVETKGENINLTYSRDGQCIVVGNKKDLLTWIDARTNKVLGEVVFPSETNEFAFDVSGQLFCATTGKGTVDVYQGDIVAGSFKRAASLPAHAAQCQSISFSPNGKWFAVGSVDSLVSMWDRGELVCLRTMSRFKSAPRSISYSHDSQYLASGGEDGLIDVALSTDGTQVATVKVAGAINALSWSPSSLALAYAADAYKSSSFGAVYLATREEPAAK